MAKEERGSGQGGERGREGKEGGREKRGKRGCGRCERGAKRKERRREGRIGGVHLDPCYLLQQPLIGLEEPVSCLLDRGMQLFAPQHVLCSVVRGASFLPAHEDLDKAKWV